MTTLAKVFAVVVLVFSVALASGMVVYLSNAANYKDQLEKEKTNRQTDVTTLTGQMEEQKSIAKTATDAKQTALDQVATMKAEVGQKDTRLAEKDGQITALQKKNQELTAAVTSIEDTLKKQATEITKLSGEKEDYRLKADEATRAKEKAEDDLKSCKVALDNSQAALADAKKALDEANIMVTNMQSAAPGANVSIPAPASMPATPINGRVVNVDNQAGLVVISVGKDDGVKDNYTFEVYRDNQYVGRIKIIEVLADGAIGKIDPAMTKSNQIMENDYVSTRLQ